MLVIIYKSQLQQFSSLPPFCVDKETILMSLTSCNLPSLEMSQIIFTTQNWTANLVQTHLSTHLNVDLYLFTVRKRPG